MLKARPVKILCLKWFDRDSSQNLFVVMAALYASVLFLGGNNATSVQPVLSIERTVFYRERAAGMYSPLPYAVAQVSIFTDKLILLVKNYICMSFLIVKRIWLYVLMTFFFSVYQGIIEIPYVMIQTLIYGVITYFMINFEREAGMINFTGHGSLWSIICCHASAKLQKIIVQHKYQNNFFPHEVAGLGLRTNKWSTWKLGT